MLSPVLGSSPGIRAQDITLAAPLNVRDVTVFLMGSNRQLDFQNIGFTAEVSAPVPEPASEALMGGSACSAGWRFGSGRAPACRRAVEGLAGAAPAASVATVSSAGTGWA